VRVIDLSDTTIRLDQFGSADYLSGIEAEKQILRNALLIYLGGWFDDLTAGVDWLGILGKGFTTNQIKSEISRVLNSLDIVEDVLIISLGIVNQNRDVEIGFSVRTTSGNQVDFAEVV